MSGVENKKVQRTCPSGLLTTLDEIFDARAKSLESSFEPPSLVDARRGRPSSGTLVS
jgi:hypothetical protein